MSSPSSLVLPLAGATLLGMATWSFTEYLMHRFLGHACKGRNHFSREHLAHHSDPNYFAPSWQKAIVALVALSALFALTRLVVPPHLALVYSASFALTYGFYEVLHRRIHTHAPLGAYGRMVRKHHLSHHFTDARHCHGVTSRVWDRVFKTHKPIAKVRVPRKLATRWMLAADGELEDRFAHSYTLVGRKS